MRPSAVLQSTSLRLLQRPWLDRASRRRDVLEIAALLSEGRPIELRWDEIEDREFLHLYDLLMDPLDELRQRSRVYESMRFALSLLSDVLGASLPAWREALMFPVQVERSIATHADWVRASQRYSSPWPDVESARLLGLGVACASMDRTRCSDDAARMHAEQTERYIQDWLRLLRAASLGEMLGGRAFEDAMFLEVSEDVRRGWSLVSWSTSDAGRWVAAAVDRLLRLAGRADER